MPNAGTIDYDIDLGALDLTTVSVVAMSDAAALPETGASAASSSSHSSSCCAGCSCCCAEE